jgi:long-chain acyl-CoA synthetase
VKSENVLITGATGAFGKYLFRQLVSAGSDITALVRAEDDEAASARLKPFIDESAKNRVKVLRADLTKDRLGLSRDDYEGLRQTVTAVLHAAASTRFDLSSADAREHNVTTLRNMLTFTDGAKQLTKFGYVGTAFVAGKRTGEVPEASLDAEAGFVNTYDQTKFEAEELLRAKLPGLPAAIYRPSLIVAPDSGPYHAAVVVLNLIKKQALPVVPGEPDDLIDMISAHDAANAIITLFAEHFSPGGTYNIVSGKRAPTLDDVIGIARQPEQRITYTGYDAKTYDAAVQQLTAKIPALAPVYQKIDCFIKYLCYPKQFATAHTEKALGQPPIHEDVLAILSELV